MPDKAVLLGQFKCLKSSEELFYEGFATSKHYSTYNFSLQWHSNAQVSHLMVIYVCLYLESKSYS